MEFGVGLYIQIRQENSQFVSLFLVQAFTEDQPEWLEWRIPEKEVGPSLTLNKVTVIARVRITGAYSCILVHKWSVINHKFHD